MDNIFHKHKEVVHPIWLSYKDAHCNEAYQKFRQQIYIKIFQLIKLQLLFIIIYDIVKNDHVYKNIIYLSYRISQIAFIVIFSWFTRKSFIMNEICIVIIILSNLIYLLVITQFNNDIVDDMFTSYYNGVFTCFQMICPLICFQKWILKSIVVIFSIVCLLIKIKIELNILLSSLIILLILIIIFYLQEKSHKLMFHQILVQQKNLNGWNKIINENIPISVFVVHQNQNNRSSSLEFSFINQHCYQLFQRQTLTNNDLISILKNIIIQKVKSSNRKTNLVMKLNPSIYDVIQNKFLYNKPSIATFSPQFDSIKNEKRQSEPSMRHESYIDCVYQLSEQVSLYLDVSLVNCNWFDTESNGKSLLITISDISLQVRNQRQQEVEQYKDKMLQTITHELKTPLNGMLCLIESSYQFTNIQQYQNINQLIRKNALLLHHMIFQIIDYCQLQKGNIDLNIQKFELKEAIEEVVDLIEFQIKEKKLDFIFKVKSSLTKIISDKIRLKCLLLIFLNNAVKFTQKGQIQLIVEDNININSQISLNSNTEQIQCHGGLKFIIEDTGIGINDKILANLQSQSEILINITDTSRESGAGIGLMFAQNLIHLLGPSQKLNIHSIVNQGTRFQFILFSQVTCRSPSILKSVEQSIQFNLQQYNNDQVESCFEQNDSILEVKDIVINDYQTMANIGQTHLPQQVKDMLFIQSIVTKSTNVLIVDDTVFNVVGLKSLLKYNNNFQVESASNGEEALNKIQQEFLSEKKYSFVFMDVNMPIMDGIQATKKIKDLIKNKLINYLQIIIVTAFTNEKDKNYFYSIGADYFIPKPITLHELANAFRHLDNTRI